MYTYKPKGVCSRQIDIELENGIIKDVKFHGGCNGNTQGIAALVIGQKPEEVIDKLSTIECGIRGTSCPAQLAIALKQAMDNE